MRNRAVIYSESDMDTTRRRRRDSDEIVIKRKEKTLEQLEEENEDKIASQMYYLNNYYNNGTQGTEAAFTEFITDFIKETIIAKDKDCTLFKELKKQKRRNSHSLTQEISDRQLIDNVILYNDPNARGKLDSDKSSSTKLSGIEENINELSLKSDIEPDGNMNYVCVRDAIAQNINLEDKVRLMLVSNGNDFIMKSLILYITNDDWVSDSPVFTIKNKVFQFTAKKTLMLSLYNTHISLHSDPLCQVYYPLMDSCIYFIDNTQRTEDALSELNSFIARIASSEKRLPIALIVNSDTSPELIEKADAIGYPITIYDINNTSDFNRVALRTIITNIMLRRPINHKQDTEEDDYFGCFDDLNCGSGYKIEDRDEEEEEDGSKLARCKSYAF